LIAAGAATSELLQLGALGLGLALLVLYLSMRIRGRDLLPRGPAPSVPFGIVEAVGVTIGSTFLQGFTLAFLRGGSGDPTALQILISFAGPLLITGLLVAMYFLRASDQDAGTVLRGAAAGPLLWLATFPVVGAVLWATTTLLDAAGVSFAEQTILTRLRPHPVLFFLIAVVCAPFVEEVLFRGLLYPAFKKKVGIGLAMGISAALFMLVHWHLQTAPAIFVLGLALAYVYERTGTLAAPIVFHACFNGWTFLGEMLP